ncbi:MAG: VWA domain-containing protein, partial [Bryobacteraceae bacterium]
MRAPHFLLALALLAFAAAGQQRPPQAPAPIFTANAHLVIVDVTVKDPKTGRPIEGLKPTDFTVLEDGKPQKISVFEFQKLAMDPEPPPPPPALADQKELPEDPKTVISTESPGHIQYHDKRLLVLFFDFTTMGVPEQLRAQDSALTFLDKQITSSDMVAILLNTGVVQVKTDFTADRDQLKSIVENLPIGDMSDLSALADMGADTEEDTGAAFVADETEFNIFNTDRKLQAIEDAVHMLATLPEKKVLLYISSGINKNGMDNQAQLEASINASVKANVAIYPIDARGLMADPPG